MGIGNVILQIDVKEMGREAFEGFRAVVLAAQGQIARFVDEAKIGAVNFLQDIERPGDGFKEALGVRLMRQADPALCGFIGGALGGRDVRIGFEADAQEVAREGIGQVEVWGNVTQAVWPMGAVFGDGKIARCHRDDEGVFL